MPGQAAGECRAWPRRWGTPLPARLLQNGGPGVGARRTVAATAAADSRPGGGARSSASRRQSPRPLVVSALPASCGVSVPGLSWCQRSRPLAVSASPASRGVSAPGLSWCQRSRPLVVSASPASRGVSVPGLSWCQRSRPLVVSASPASRGVSAPGLSWCQRPRPLAVPAPPAPRGCRLVGRRPLAAVAPDAPPLGLARRRVGREASGPNGESGPPVRPHRAVFPQGAAPGRGCGAQGRLWGVRRTTRRSRISMPSPPFSSLPLPSPPRYQGRRYQGLRPWTPGSGAKPQLWEGAGRGTARRRRQDPPHTPWGKRRTRGRNRVGRGPRAPR